MSIKYVVWGVSALCAIPMYLASNAHAHDAPVTYIQTSYPHDPAPATSTGQGAANARADVGHGPVAGHGGGSTSGGKGGRSGASRALTGLRGASVARSIGRRG